MNQLKTTILPAASTAPFMTLGNMPGDTGDAALAARFDRR